ncbi:MAG: NAD-dependent epimerase/dehydratase family protein [Alphaproteobacteria bacterium]|nr:NAD-dependent epimerase/dehydratase family protein [Alphaproteobacteria bacterium]
MTPQPLTFLTGATGFMGAALARTLESKGHRLRLLCRSNCNTLNLEGLTNSKVVVGDLQDPDSYSHALVGCDFLFHAAADYRIWVPDQDVMYRINVEGTQALMRAAQKAGVKKIVYTSSVATLGIPKGGIGTEDTAVSYTDMIGIYKRSKYEAEEIVRAMALEEDLPVVIVNPSTPVGPRDVKPTPTGRIIIEAATGRMPAYIDTGLNIAHVDDVAEGHWLALKKGKTGERYILGSENMDFLSILKTIAALTKQKPPVLRLPRGPLFPLAYLAESLAKITGKEPFLTADGLRMAGKRMFFSSEKAMRELGYAPRPAEKAIADALIWFQKNGYLA